MAELQFVRNKKYGTMGTNKNGWTKEVCNVSWNQKQPKLDIREWSPDYRKMSRGITLTKQEAKRLLAILAGIDFEEFDGLAERPEAPMQVRPAYGNMPQQATVPVAAPVAANRMQQAPAPAVPVAPTAAAAAVPEGNAQQTIVITGPEVISMQEEMEMTETDMEDTADLQSMAMPVTAI